MLVLDERHAVHAVLAPDDEGALAGVTVGIRVFQDFEQVATYAKATFRKDRRLSIRFEQGLRSDSEAGARRGVAVSDVDREPVTQVCGRPVKGILISVSQDPVASCCVDHLSAGWMFWFPRKKFVGSYFCLSAASCW